MVLKVFFFSTIKDITHIWLKIFRGVGKQIKIASHLLKIL